MGWLELKTIVLKCLQWIAPKIYQNIEGTTTKVHFTPLWVVKSFGPHIPRSFSCEKAIGSDDEMKFGPKWLIKVD